MKWTILGSLTSFWLHAGLLAAAAGAWIAGVDHSEEPGERLAVGQWAPPRATVMTGPPLEERFEPPSFVDPSWHRARMHIPRFPKDPGPSGWLARQVQYPLKDAQLVVRPAHHLGNSGGPLTALPFGCELVGTWPGEYARYGRVITGCGSHHGSCRAIVAALDWLARHQNPDGSWSVTGLVDRCSTPCAPAPGEEDTKTGVTGLALLAFLQAGYSPASHETLADKRFSQVVRDAVRWLLDRQDADGFIGSRNVDKYMYGHAVATLALSQARSLTGSSILKDPVQNAVDFLVAAQNPGKGWRYSFACGDNDTSVTGWAVLALKAAADAGIAFPRSAYAGAWTWFDQVTDRTIGRAGYSSLNRGCFIPLGDAFERHETPTAIAVASRILMTGSANFGRVPNGNALLYHDLPAWDRNAIDFTYWFWGTLTVFQ